MNTYSTREADINREWILVDAAGQTLGRLAARIATILRGKHKPIFAPHLDTGDFVIVVNAAKIRVTGRKPEAKLYYRHSGYPGGLKSVSLGLLMEQNPTRVIEKAVRGMLPRNKLGDAMARKLKVYAGPEHPHQAQMPKKVEDK
ncbi:MAG: 50S ribosomal protein L13 [Chloroflexi bacterium]|nr:50S ribosomal protein L13 [Chloroflexota bacterium]MCL5026618.1 50S ribosomal protein L13 [Chloroflexota bacterium]